MSWIDELLASLYDMEGRDLHQLGFALCQFDLFTCPEAANDESAKP